MLTAIIVAEVTFWICLVLGCVVRYVAKLPRLGLALLATTPLIDFVLLIFLYTTLGETRSAGFVEGFSAFYIGFSVVFGRDIINFLDRKFSGKPAAAAGDSGKNFNKMLVACLVTALLLIAGIFVTGLAGSFWLTYWLIAVAFMPLMWKGVELLLKR